MLQNKYLLANLGADIAENRQKFANTLARFSVAKVGGSPHAHADPAVDAGGDPGAVEEVAFAWAPEEGSHQRGSTFEVGMLRTVPSRSKKRSLSASRPIRSDDFQVERVTACETLAGLQITR